MQPYEEPCLFSPVKRNAVRINLASPAAKATLSQEMAQKRVPVLVSKETGTMLAALLNKIDTLDHWRSRPLFAPWRVLIYLAW